MNSFTCLPLLVSLSSFFLLIEINEPIMFRIILLFTLLATVFSFSTNLSESEPPLNTITDDPQEQLVKAVLGDLSDVTDAISLVSKMAEQESQILPRFYSVDDSNTSRLSVLLDPSQTESNRRESYKFEMIPRANPPRVGSFSVGSIGSLIDPRVRRIRKFIRERINPREYREVDCSLIESPLTSRDATGRAGASFRSLFRRLGSDGQVKCYENYATSSHRLFS